MYYANMSGATVSATNWLISLLLGALGTVIAVVAVAMVGVALLHGRMPTRRGASVIIGCFILFSARTIATGITGEVMTPALPAPASSLQPPAYVASVPQTAPYDPYAGAAVPVRPRDGTPDLMAR